MDGLIKIGDFGLVTNTVDNETQFDLNQCKTRNRLHKHTNDVGTQLYMSPEQVILINVFYKSCLILILLK